jgi:hypothetical protein
VQLHEAAELASVRSTAAQAKRRFPRVGGRGKMDSSGSPPNPTERLPASWVDAAQLAAEKIQRSREAR